MLTVFPIFLYSPSTKIKETDSYFNLLTTSYLSKFKYKVIQLLNKEKEYSIVSLCKTADISRSAYYKWLNKVDSKNEKINESLIKEIISLYEEVGGIYGYRKITMNSNRKLNSKYNLKRIYRLMKILGLKRKDT